MSPQPGRRGRRQSVVLLYGENKNDTGALKELLVALEPVFDGRVSPRRETLREVKNARPQDLPSRGEELRKLVAVEHSARDVACVFVHEDCDAVEPAHERLLARLEETHSASGLPTFGVAPAWELEAWWFLWPDQAKLRASWRRPDGYVGRDVGRIANAKEAFTAAVRPPGANRKGFPDYAESDSAAIARRVREAGVADSPLAQSRSYDAFRERSSRAASTL